MTELPQAWRSIIARIDAFTRGTAWIVSWFTAVLIIAVSYEVIARRVFNEPTVWAFDLTYMFYGALFMLGSHYALLKGAHIRTDMLWDKYSDRKKGVVDSIAYLVFFFPSLILLFWISVDDAYYAWQIGETSEQTAWRPLIYPLKMVVPLTALLLFVQGISELLKSLYAARSGRAYEQKQGSEV